MKPLASLRKMLLQEFEKSNGILPLKPTWVARNSMPAGLRLGLPQEQVCVGERGWICERWLGSTTHADNPTGPADEGLTYLALSNNEELTLKLAVELIPEKILGTVYAQNHSGLNRLAKLFDMGDRIAFHFHHQEKDAVLVGQKPKEEAYYFPPGVEMGKHPETFFGFHPFMAEIKNRDLLLPHLLEWKDDQILRYSRAFQLFPDEGFHVPAGIPHAPGTALTLELQEDSDVFAVLQAFSADALVPKELLFKNSRAEDRKNLGESLVLNQLNWELSTDPYFYENRHTSAQLIKSSIQSGGREYWIFYNTSKFSGKKLVVGPGEEYSSLDKGVYNLLVWQGQGNFAGLEIKAGYAEQDELFVSHQRAVQPIKIKNTGNEALVIFKFFGPDINDDAPMIRPYRG
jgi:hypothetical protein